MLDIIQHVSVGLKKVFYLYRKFLGLLKHCLHKCDLVWINTKLKLTFIYIDIIHVYIL